MNTPHFLLWDLSSHPLIWCSVWIKTKGSPTPSIPVHTPSYLGEILCFLSAQWLLQIGKQFELS